MPTYDRYFRETAIAGWREIAQQTDPANRVRLTRLADQLEAAKSPPWRDTTVCLNSGMANALKPPKGLKKPKATEALQAPPPPDTEQDSERTAFTRRLADGRQVPVRSTRVKRRS